MKTILYTLLIILSFNCFAQNRSNNYSIIYSAKKNQFMHIIDSIITNNANPQAQKFALKNDSFNCYIFINDKLISINSKEINLKEFYNYTFFICCAYPFSSEYILRYRQKYYGFGYRISELFNKKINQQNNNCYNKPVTKKHSYPLYFILISYC